jgi:hypothetical protein
MKKEISQSKVAERNKLVEFVVESKKKAPTGGPSHTGFCRIIYFRHADHEEEDYTYGFK